MNEDLIDALIQLVVSVVALYWWWRAEWWKRKAETDVKAEREACANLCDAQPYAWRQRGWVVESSARSMSEDCAGGIRARSNAPHEGPGGFSPGQLDAVVGPRENGENGENDDNVG